MSDSFFAGIHPTGALMAPLLQAPLITLFRNAVLETTTRQDKDLDMFTYSPTTKLVLKYLSLKDMPVNHYDCMSDPMAIKWSYALSNATTYDHMFDRFVNNYKFSELEWPFGVAMKEKHTVIEKWPFRLRLQPDQPGAMEEFDRLVDAVVFAKEGYVEWRRT